MILNKEDALYCARIFQDYFDNFDRIDDYMRNQKKMQIDAIGATLPGMGPEDDLFDDYTMNPEDMEFDVQLMPGSRWNDYVKIISSHTITASIPGRNAQFSVIEKNSGKIVGFIRLGSPLINCKPRNEMLGQVFTQSKELASNFNRTAAMGFTIVPAQPFGYNYLGGKLLAAICTSHEVREIVNKKYGMNLCLFETTSLYGSSKAASQYDGMKPLLRFKGLTDSNFIPMMHGKPYEDLKSYVENAIGVFVPEDASSRKMKISNTIIAMTKASLKGTPEGEKFNKTIENALSLTEKKRYYASNYGFSNFTDVVMGRADKLIPDKENYDKHYLENIIEWWKKKATNRYETLKAENRIRQEIEVWTGEKELDIIR